jgi:hypothetical protein
VRNNSVAAFWHRDDVLRLMQHLGLIPTPEGASAEHEATAFRGRDYSTASSVHATWGRRSALIDVNSSA